MRSNYFFDSESWSKRSIKLPPSSQFAAASFGVLEAREWISDMGFVGRGKIAVVGDVTGLWTFPLSDFNSEVVSFAETTDTVNWLELQKTRFGFSNVTIEPFANFTNFDGVFDSVLFLELLPSKNRIGSGAIFRSLKAAGTLSIVPVANEGRRNALALKVKIVGERFRPDRWRVSTKEWSHFDFKTTVYHFERRGGRAAQSSTSLETNAWDQIKRELDLEFFDYSSSLRIQFGDGDDLDFRNIENILRGGLRTQRTEFLRAVFARVTNPHGSSLEKIRQCLTFAQQYFYHDLVREPRQRNGLSVFCPVSSLVVRSARCGSSARFLVDLLLVNGYDARLVATGCHTFAEVFFERNWLILDTDLTGPGEIPIDRDGSWLTTRSAIEEPVLLDHVPSYVHYNQVHFALVRERYGLTDANLRSLAEPLFPSTAWFGERYSNANSNRLLRFEKTGSAINWETDVDFGWLRTKTEFVGIRPIPHRDRGAQVQASVLDGRIVVDGLSSDELLEFYASDVSRGWNYSRMPKAPSFIQSGRLFKGPESTPPMIDLRRLGRFVSVLRKKTDRPDAFYLPSEELDLDAIS